MAASTISGGVGKSGSPAPKPMTGRPAAFSALAFASTASVADSAMPPIRAEIRRGVTVVSLMLASSQIGQIVKKPAVRVRPVATAEWSGITQRSTLKEDVVANRDALAD